MTQRRRPWPLDIRLSVLMVLSDPGEMTLSLLSSADPPADVTSLASVHIATNLSHCHDGNILSQVNDKELTDPEAKSTRIMIVGVLGLNMVLLCIYCISLFKNISIFKYSLHFRTFTFTLHLQCNTTLSPLFVKDWTNLQRSKS